MIDNTQASFFISYSSKDKVFADRVCEILETNGHKVFYQERDFGKRDFMQSMHYALEQSLKSDWRIISLYSPDYFKSDYCMKEAFTALHDDPFNKKERLIPLRISECAPGGLLANIPYYDLVSLRDNDALLTDIILAVVKPGSVVQMSGFRPELWKKPSIHLHPEIHQVPNFSARADELKKLKHILFSGQTAAVTATISAMGGVGKTVLAKQYGWENQADYAGVWWIASENPESIITGLVELGSKFGTGIECIEDRKEAVQLTLLTIAEGGYEKPWLLIYDNIEDPTALNGMTPRSGSHVLVTSRWKDWDGYADVLDLELFSDEDAVQFLLKRTGSTDEDGAKELANILGNLPLALEQAAAYCRNGIGFADYISAYQDMLKKQPKPNSLYPSSVWATFTLALENVIEGDENKGRPPCPEAAKLLDPIAYLASDDIPLEIFPENYLFPSERITVVNTLADVSLITPVVLPDGSQGLSLHRLVQEVVRDRNEEAEKPFQFAMEFIANKFPDVPSDVRFWPQCQKLEPHVRRVLGFAQNAITNTNQNSEANLCIQYATYLKERADYSSAEPLCRRALKILEDSLGPDHPQVAFPLNTLANLLQSTNSLSEAEPLYRRAIKIREDTLGPDHLYVASLLNNLANLLLFANRQSEAEPLYRRAIKIREDSLGPDHLYVASPLNGLANLLSDIKHFAEAELLYRRALKIWEASLGPNHPSVAVSLNNLANLLRETKRLSEAKPLYRRAIKIREGSLGLDHPHTAYTLNSLANLLSDTKHFAEAEPLYRRALKIWEASLGPDHPYVALALDGLAMLMKETSCPLEAEPLFRLALKVREGGLPEGHPFIEESRENLRLFLEQKGLSDEKDFHSDRHSGS